jgi:hypothetical protein
LFSFSGAAVVFCTLSLFLLPYLPHNKKRDKVQNTTAAPEKKKKKGKQ